MAEDTGKAGSKGSEAGAKADAKSEPEVSLRQPTKLSASEHISHAKEYHGVPASAVAGGISYLVTAGKAAEGDELTSEEVRYGIDMFMKAPVTGDDEGARS